MAKINLLPVSVSELIAAGEVVERPASVVKETVENSIDAGSRHITVEIKHGGITFIRITDDGCGIEEEDVPTAFLRHATSKIKSQSDLDSINTLGFRGEALAAICSVARVEMLTKTKDSQYGTHYIIDGGKETENCPAGCPDGTTLIIRDLFFNTPARMKFLKKDVSEGTAVGAVLERTALSHPEIAFKFIRDGKTVFTTSGNGNALDTIYSVLGREFHSSLIKASGEENGVLVEGFVCKPVFCRATRSHQITFLNGRLVISRTVAAAVEQAYKGSSMVGKFPAFVLFITIPPETVDVNVHPAKTEVRFSDEKRIFSAVHYAVKSALTSGDTRPAINVAPKGETFFKMGVNEYRQTAVKIPEKGQYNEPAVLKQDSTPFFLREDVKKYLGKTEEENKTAVTPERQVFDPVKEIKSEKAEPQPDFPQEKPKYTEYSPEKEVVYIGEVFSTYIIAQMGETIYFIDKHAAHERILYNKLKSETEIAVQPLLSPVTVKLSGSEHTAITENTELLEKAGFEIEDFGNGTVLVRAVPAILNKSDITDICLEIAQSLSAGGGVNPQKADDIFHSVACKAAIKAGYKTSKEEQTQLAQKILSNNDIMYCPHGRPVAYSLKKNELHKYFGRIQ